MYIALSEALDRVLRFAPARLVASSDSSTGAARPRPRRVSSRPLSAWEVPRLPDAATALTPDPAQPPTRHRSARGHERVASRLSFLHPPRSSRLSPSCPRALLPALCRTLFASRLSLLHSFFARASRPVSSTLAHHALVGHRLRRRARFVGRCRPGRARSAHLYHLRASARLDRPSDASSGPAARLPTRTRAFRPASA